MPARIFAPGFTSKFVRNPTMKTESGRRQRLIEANRRGGYAPAIESITQNAFLLFKEALEAKHAS